jgi:tRNA pseudouridine55 synthase
MGRRAKGRAVHGWLVLDKPEGLTSTRAGARVRAMFGAAKAGHAGTLDPLATGLLPIAFGEATKTMPFALDRTKVYRFTARWGEAYDTDDRDGAVVETSAARPTPDALAAALPRFVGRIEQVPPAFSAVKVEGRRAHAMARAGEAPALKSRIVDIRRLDLLDAADPDHAVLEMECGSGTYVRALVRDLARALGTVGHVVALRRTALGPFGEADAISLENLAQLGDIRALDERLLPVETPLDDIPAVAVTGADAARLRRGQPILLRESFPSDGATVCAMARGRPVALASVVEGLMRPTRVFNLPFPGAPDVDHA